MKLEVGATEYKEIMTTTVIDTVTEIVDNLIKMKQQIPFSLTFMLRLMLEKVVDVQNQPITAQEAPMLADFLAGTWLSNAFRNPECFGMEPVFREESLTMTHLLSACRLVFETIMACD